MPKSETIITLISNVNSSTSHENTVANFITVLPQPLNLKEKRWECALCEVIVPGITPYKFREVFGNENNRPPYVLGNSLIVNVKTNIIEPTHYSSLQKRILRSIVIKAVPKEEFTHLNFENVRFYPICKQFIREIEIKFELPTGDKVPFDDKRSQVVLCVRPQL